MFFLSPLSERALKKCLVHPGSPRMASKEREVISLFTHISFSLAISYFFYDKSATKFDCMTQNIMIIF